MALLNLRMFVVNQILLKYWGYQANPLCELHVTVGWHSIPGLGNELRNKLQGDMEAGWSSLQQRIFSQVKRRKNFKKKMNLSDKSQGENKVTEGVPWAWNRTVVKYCDGLETSLQSNGE